MSRNIQTFEFTDKELAMVSAGIADGARDKASMDMAAIEAAIPKLQELQTARVAAATTREKAAGAAYLAKAATEKDANKTASGLVYRTVLAGTGAAPTAADTVKVHYEGRFVDGKVFDSSRERNEPATFPLNGVIPCWTEAVQLMKVGGKAHVTCPPDLAYGDEGRPPQMRGGATLVFDVELLDIVKQDPAAAGAAPAAQPATK
jgi:FKBP-type peptidyl-prolyl cis-trans isomerase